MNSAAMDYDIIGDVHGCAAALEQLLKLLGYTKRQGVFEYRDSRSPRQAIFVGDILDRGPAIREAMDIVRGMVERGSAQLVMGNHEYDALGYTTLDPAGDGQQYLREHNRRHTRSIEATLDQYANHSGDWHDLLQWLYQLPLFLDFEAFRVVHACWDQALIDEFLRRRKGATIDRDFLIESADYQSFAGRFMSRITRGSSLLLPDNLVMTSREGFQRRLFRAKFWVDSPQTYSDIEFQPDPLPLEVMSMPLPAHQLARLPFYGPEQKPLFFGHYWLRGRPRPLTGNIACLDYSAVNGGRLVAYRFDDKKPLSADHFVWVENH